MQYIVKFINNLLKIIISYLLSPIVILLIHLRSQFIRQDKLRILIIQTQKIGDMVCTIPVFREIKLNKKNTFICVLISHVTKELLLNNPFVDEVIVIQETNLFKLGYYLAKSGFLYSFNFSPSINTILLCFFSLIKNRITILTKYATKSTKLVYPLANKFLNYKPHTDISLSCYFKAIEFLNIKKYNLKREVFLNEEDIKKAETILKNYNLKNRILIGILPFAGVKIKEWPPENYVELIIQIIKKYKVCVVLFGGEGEIKESKSLIEDKLPPDIKKSCINLVGKLPLMTTSALLKHMYLVIGADVGPLYIADALNVKTIDIAGPSDMSNQRPHHARIIQPINKINCIPCSYILKGSYSCRRGDRACVTYITPEDVLKVVATFFDTTSKV